MPSATKIPQLRLTAYRSESYVVERLDQLRISINTGRAELLIRLEEQENELRKWTGENLRALADQQQHHKKRAAASSHLAPAAGSRLSRHWCLPSCWFIGLRVRRGGKGIGVLLAIAILVFYYLLSPTR